MMRLVTSIAVVLASVSLGAQTPPQQVRLNDALPGPVRTTQLVLSADGRRVYYGDSTRAVWFYDRTDKRNVRLVAGEAWDLTLSPTGDALAYTRTTTESAAQYVWILPLDARTGLASGPERRASATQGDAPSISPDGKSLAFARDDSTGVGQSIVVIPMAAGRERIVVPSLHTGVASIRWSPDGRTLFFGANPPVECNPDWSCLPLKAEFQIKTGTVRRAAVNGGAPTVIVPKLYNGWPGLSPDGSVLAYIDTGFPVRVIVADTTGRTLQSFPMPNRQTIEGWSSGSTLVFSDRGDVRRLRSYSMADGATRLVVDSLQQLAEPSVSADGQSISTVHCAVDRCDLRLSKADGSLIRLVALPDRYGAGNLWSADGRWVAYIGGPGNGDRHVNLVDAASGRVTTLTTFRANAASLLWLPDSRGVILTATTGGGTPARRVDFQRISIEGQVRQLRGFAVGVSPSGGAAVTPTTAVLFQDGEMRTVAIDGDSANAQLMPKIAIKNSSYIVLAVGDDRVAVRRPTESDATTLDIARFDGSDRVSIDLPFWVFTGPNNRRFLPGGKQLVLIGGPTADTPDAAAYLVSVETKEIKKLFSLPLRSLTGDLVISPDGRTILYVSSETAAPRVYTMDLSSLRK